MGVVDVDVGATKETLALLPDAGDAGVGVAVELAGTTVTDDVVTGDVPVDVDAADVDVADVAVDDVAAVTGALC